MKKYLLTIFFYFTCALLHGDTYQDLINNCSPEQTLALEEAFDMLGQEKRQDVIFTPVDKGMTRARLYSFNLDHQPYVLRFLDAKHPQEQRYNEIRACTIAHCLNLGPQCFFADKNAFLMIMPLIQGHQLSSKDLENPKTIADLAAMLHSLHSYSGDYPMRYPFRERLRMHYEKGLHCGIAYPTGFDASIQSVLTEITHQSVAPCHGDLNPSNILIDNNGTAYFIDWTSATWDDPFTDLSYLSLLSNMSHEQTALFLQSYLNREPTVSDFERLKQGQLKVYLLTAAIWLRFSDNDQTIPYHERVAQLDAELHSPTLKNAHEYLREGIVVDLRRDSKEAITTYALSFYKAYLDHLNHL